MQELLTLIGRIKQSEGEKISPTKYILKKS